ncbi:hypothetical protein [Arthrobacter sp. NamB2]|uniref:hypothetical protein n=1 Tax=Arthrobacter sp. NamB2 TaxID=2576035 RepID=UPI0016776AC7|nr:hypothetical protein [Arthrobacter sp. NamB2]
MSSSAALEGCQIILVNDDGGVLLLRDWFLQSEIAAMQPAYEDNAVLEGFFSDHP